MRRITDIGKRLRAYSAQGGDLAMAPAM